MLLFWNIQIHVSNRTKATHTHRIETKLKLNFSTKKKKHNFRVFCFAIYRQAALMKCMKPWYFLHFSVHQSIRMLNNIYDLQIMRKTGKKLYIYSNYDVINSQTIWAHNQHSIGLVYTWQIAIFKYIFKCHPHIHSRTSIYHTDPLRLWIQTDISDNVAHSLINKFQP